MLSNSFIELPNLNFPEKYQFRIKKENNILFIFCDFRKKWLILTPEEWVRQHALCFLSKDLNYPKALINTEVPINVYGLRQRVDILIFLKGKPFMLCECKEPKVKINQSTLDQALRYNAVLNAEWVYLTNGKQHVVTKIEEGKTLLKTALPSYF